MTVIATIGRIIKTLSGVRIIIFPMQERTRNGVRTSKVELKLTITSGAWAVTDLVPSRACQVLLAPESMSNVYSPPVGGK